MKSIPTILEEFEFDVWPMEKSYALCSNAHMEKIAAWLRSTLTTHRNDVLEGVLAKFPEDAVTFDPRTTGSKAKDIYNAALNEIRTLIHSLKEDKCI